jgi:anti-sigma B factor antagonist
MPSTDLSVTVEQDRAVIALRGEHEAYTAHKIGKQLEALLDEGVPVAVDLREATFVDSTVVGVLLAAKRHADQLELEFVLIMGEGTGWPVRRLLEVTGLDSTFDVVVA